MFLHFFWTGDADRENCTTHMSGGGVVVVVVVGRGSGSSAVYPWQPGWNVVRFVMGMLRLTA